MSTLTTKNYFDNIQQRDAAADVATDVPLDANNDVAVDDRERRAAVRWIHVDDLVMVSQRAPAGPAPSGQRDGDARTERQGTGVSGATASRRSRRSESRPRKQREATFTDGKHASTAAPANLGPWLDVRGAAEYLSMRERAVRDLWRRGVLPGHRFGGSVRFGVTELDRFLEARRQDTLQEVSSRSRPALPSPIGPLMSPEQAAAYIGVSSAEAIVKRAERRQVPAYRISERILRFSAADLDAALSGNRLTPPGGGPTIPVGACLPEGRR